MKLSVKDAVNAFAAKAGRDFGDDRMHTVGASEVGQCERKTWFAKFESDAASSIDRDDDYDDRWGAKVRGTIYEDRWWAPALKAQYGEALLYAGEDQRTLYSDYLSATPDGLVTGLASDALAHLGVADIESDCVALECKTADPRTRLDEAKPEHRFQVIVQLGLIRATTNHKPMWGVISYTDTSFWDEVLEFPVRFDESVFQTALDRSNRIMRARAAGELKPEGRIAGGRECDYCPFKKACGFTGTARLNGLRDLVPVDAEKAEAIAAKARTAKAHKQEAESIANLARALEEEIKTELSAVGARTLRLDAVSVTWSNVKGRPSTDWKALREAAEEAGVETSRFTTVGEPTDRLTITIKERQA